MSKVDLKLFPGERVVGVEEHPIEPLTTYPLAVEALQKLAGVTRHQDIGKRGPVIGSVVTDKNKHIKALRYYEALFGRDSLVVALFLTNQYPLLLKNTIIRLAELQGVEYNKYREEEPGRIIHEYRDPHIDERARELTRKSGWEWPYYGSVDATILFVRAIYRYCSHFPEGLALLKHEYKGRDGEVHTIMDAFLSSIRWIKHRMDHGERGFIEFKPAFQGSLESQSWKDSWDVYHHADLTIANHSAGVASVEVQAAAYDALIDAAILINTPDLKELFPAKKDYFHKEKIDLIHRAESMKKHAIQLFWVEEKGGYFALGLDKDNHGKLRPMKIRTSNMGHLLNSRFLDGKDLETIVMRKSIIAHLFSDEMLNASGIRTLAKGDGRYRSGSYQNGSVWPWDTYFISLGLRRHGYDHLAEDLENRILNVVNTFKKFPEFVRGDEGDNPTINTKTIDLYDDANRHENRVEQPPQEIQAWTVAAVSAIEYHRTTNVYNQVYI